MKENETVLSSQALNVARSLGQSLGKFPFDSAVREYHVDKVVWKPTIGHYRNVRGLGKSMVVLRLSEKLRYSNERSTIF